MMKKLHVSCGGYLFHRHCLIDPKELLAFGINIGIFVQRPGDVVVTHPASFHMVVNLSVSINEASNFALPEWVPFGMR